MQNIFYFSESLSVNDYWYNYPEIAITVDGRRPILKPFGGELDGRAEARDSRPSQAVGADPRDRRCTEGLDGMEDMA